MPDAFLNNSIKGSDPFLEFLPRRPNFKRFLRFRL